MSNNTKVFDPKNTPDKNGFKVRGQKFLLTWSHHIVKEDLKKFLQDVCQRHANKVIEVAVFIAHELGEGDGDVPYKHTHAAVDCGSGKVMNQANDAGHMFCIDMPGYNNGACGFVHCHISTVPTKQQFKYVLKYVSKEDAECKREVMELQDTKTTVRDIVVSSGTTNKMDFLAESTRDNILRDKAIVDSGVYNFIIRPQQIKPIIYFDWQTFWYYQIIPDTSQRRIISVCYDPNGGNGKTVLQDYCLHMLGRDCIRLNYNGKSTDVLYYLGCAIRDGWWTGKVLMVNLTRGQTEYSGLYQVLETIKDGCVSSFKYTGVSESIPPICSIHVFTNELPDVDKLTHDRWRIYKLESWSEDHAYHTITEELYHKIDKLYPRTCVPFDPDVPRPPDWSIIQHAETAWWKRHNKLEAMSVHDVRAQRKKEHESYMNDAFVPSFIPLAAIAPGS